MTRSIIGLMLLAAAGTTWAQLPGAANVQTAMSTLIAGSPSFPGGLSGSAGPFLAGNTTDGFAANRNGFSGFAIELTRDTAFAEAGPIAADFFAMGYDTLLPLYLVADEVLIPLAEPGLPFTQPLADAIVEFAQLATMDGGSGAGLAGLSALTGSGSLPGLQ